MDWYAVDRYGRKWFPYVTTDIHSAPYVELHMEGADTDMGDMSPDELALYLGPVTIETRRAAL